jgi:hypothetical protein
VRHGLPITQPNNQTRLPQSQLKPVTLFSAPTRPAVGRRGGRGPPGRTGSRSPVRPGPRHGGAAHLRDAHLRDEGILRGYLKATGKRRPTVPIHLPGKAARAFRNGANLAPDHATGRRTWEEFLADSQR